MPDSIAPKLQEQLANLRTTTLPGEWVKSVMEATTKMPVSPDLASGVWVAVMFVAAFKHGRLDGPDMPERSDDLTAALNEAQAHVDKAYPGFLDAPALIAFIDRQFTSSPATSVDGDASPVEVQDDPAEVSWYGISRMSAGVMVLMANDGDSLPALQVRLFNSIDEEVFCRMLPFGDALFLAIGIVENIGEALAFQQMSFKNGNLSQDTRAHLRELVSEADEQLSKLKRALDVDD